MDLKTWAPIVLGILTLAGGTGWLQYFLKKSEAKRERYRTILEDFLRPFKGVLIETHQVFDKLRDERDLQSMEYHPERLQEHFGALADGDPRKQLWNNYIERLQRENDRALALLDRFYGRIILDEFRIACDKYIEHAKEWKMMWDALSGSGKVPAPLAISGTLLAPQFPPELEPALQNEIVEVERRAGQ